ncbi:MAG: hypothetical protein FWE61_06850 [Micrococcales bacterium]|nr:hypothetical protein [Micrococcales bacterium]
MMTRGNRWWCPVGVVLMVAALASGGCAADDPGRRPALAAAWAEPVLTGDELWQVTTQGLTVTAYLMGEDTAAAGSFVVDDVTNAPVVAAGDRLVFVNLVVTNTSKTITHVATDQPKLRAAPAQSPYERGVAEITLATDAQWRAHDVWYHTVRVGAGAGSYPLAPGESCARGYVLPLTLGLEWAFVAAVWVYDGPDDPGHAVTFDRQTYTFN